MLAFFIIGSVSTRYQFSVKEQMGVEQAKGGARGYLNVFSNGIVAAGAAVLWGISGDPLFSVLFVGSVATAAGDTLASEIGVIAGEPYLITNFSRVPPGTNGGVTALGEIMAFFGALLIAFLAFLIGVIPFTFVAASAVAGFVGTNIDSIIGAVFENRGVFGNAGTNFVATAGGGLCALLLSLPFTG
jgi:uncharacterized protein (TIGR00297 family)